MVLSDLSRKEQKLEELEKVLNKFKQGENFHKFRNTARHSGDRRKSRRDRGTCRGHRRFCRNTGRSRRVAEQDIAGRLRRIALQQRQFRFRR